MNSRLTATVTVLAVLVSLRAHAEPAMILKARLADLVPTTDESEFDEFGFAVAADGNVAVVGAPYFSPPGMLNAGAAYVYEWTGASWTQVARLTASDAVANSQFGSAVAVSGDTIVVGAPELDVEAGAVYVFVKSGSGWTSATETTSLRVTDLEPYDAFGASVGISGDTIVVGASGYHGTFSGQGAAFVFVKPDSGWSDMAPTAVLRAGSPEVNHLLGVAVAIDQDTIVARSTTEVWVFEKPAGGWVDGSHTARLYPSDLVWFVWYSDTSLAVSGDTIAVEASPDAVYLFTKPVGGWTDVSQTARLTRSDDPNEPTDRFARSLSLSSDTLAVGFEGYYSGGAYVFEKPPGGWVDMTETARLSASNPNNALGGWAVALAGARVIAGAPAGPDDSFLDFEKPAGVWSDATETRVIRRPSPGELFPFAKFSQSVGIDGETIGVLAGDNGRVFVYTFGGVDWQKVATLRPSGGTNVLFSDVLVSGDTIFASAWLATGPHVHVFPRPAGGWTDMTEAVRVPGRSPRVSPSGDVLVALTANRGEFFLYERPAGGWSTVGLRSATLQITTTAFPPQCPVVSALGVIDFVVSDDAVLAMGSTDGCYDANFGLLFERPAGGWGDPPIPPTRRESKYFPVDSESVGQMALHGDTLLMRDAIYARPSSGWDALPPPLAVLTQSDPQAGDYFGLRWTPVAFNDSLAVITASRHNGTVAGEGAAYVYFKPPGGWADTTESLRLSNPLPLQGDGFGGSLAVSGATMLVGSIVDDNNVANETGQAYVFVREFDSDGVADAADNCPGVANAGQEDADSNGVGDACECPGSAAAVGETAVSAGGGTVPFATNRFLSFHGGSTGQSQAIRITMTSLPGAFSAWNGASAWVGNPVTICETAGIGSGGACPAGAATFSAATLACSPVCRSDWDSAGTINLTGRGIVPGATYEVQLVDCGCDYAHPLAYSPSLVLATSRFGDVAGPFSGSQWTATDGRTDVTIDVTSGLAKFANRPGAPSKVRIDSDWPIPDYRVNISDVTRLLDGFRGLAFAGSPGAAGPCTGG